MKVSVKTAGTTPEILKRKLGAEYSRPVTVDETAFTSGVCKAGTPLDIDGKVANSASVAGILWNDVYEENPNGSIIVGYAVINEAVAKAWSGITLDPAVKTALPTLSFE